MAVAGPSGANIPHSLRYIDYICPREVMIPILQEIEKSLGIPIIFLDAPPDRSGPKIQQAEDVFGEGFADFGRICSPAYALARHFLHPIVAPASDATSHFPSYFSQLFVRKESSFQTLLDLKGSIFAFNDDSSLSGFYCLLFYLRTAHPNALPFFASAFSTGSHFNSVQAVLDGLADVVCLDCVVLERFRQHKQNEDGTPFSALDMSSLRSIPVPYLVTKEGRSLGTQTGLLGPNPAQPIVVSERISLQLRERIQLSLLNLSPELLLPTLSSYRYLPVTEQDYRGVIEMMTECEAIQISQTLETVSERKRNSGAEGDGSVNDPNQTNSLLAEYLDPRFISPVLEEHERERAREEAAYSQDLTLAGTLTRS
jgi:ABC-type phosphate/phosphonate transport system substrate-binding protein